MNLKQALAHVRAVLAENNIEDASLEGEILLRHALGIDRNRLFLDLDREMSPQQEKVLLRLVERRLRGEPSAYITGHREFYGLDYYVDPRVLIPRPETELLVEKAIELTRSRRIATIAEVGTGCGAIAISLAINLPGTGIYATDISTAALEVARSNCLRHGVSDRILLLQGNMLDPLPGPVDLIIANLPYVRESELSRGGPLSFEPRLALDGGPDGMRKIGSLCCQAGGKLSHGGCLLLEMGQGQGKTVLTLLHQNFPSAMVEVFTDLSGIERVVCLCSEKS